MGDSFPLQHIVKNICTCIYVLTYVYEAVHVHACAFMCVEIRTMVQIPLNPPSQGRHPGRRANEGELIWSGDRLLAFTWVFILRLYNHGLLHCVNFWKKIVRASHHCVSIVNVLTHSEVRDH